MAASSSSRVWFTLARGIVTEVYYPRVDQANIRDLQLIVTNGKAWFSEEERDADTTTRWIDQGVPGYRITNRKQGKYSIVKTVLTDPDLDVLLQEVRFEALEGSLADYRLFVLLAPHIANQGFGNNGWVGDYRGLPMLFAERAGTSLALVCSVPFTARSCGYVGTSDGWQILKRDFYLTAQYDEARDGNIALTGEIDLAACSDPSGVARCVLALGFGRGSDAAALRARQSLQKEFSEIVNRYVDGWQQAGGQSSRTTGFPDLYHASIAVLRCHEDKNFPGATVASLSIPWGKTRGTDLGGYHLVWPRDLVASATGLAAVGDWEGARRTLRYLMATQAADGGWLQNMWIDGSVYWQGLQMDAVGAPILLADLLRRNQELGSLDPWPMARRAAAFLVQRGPFTPQDRWEENAGYSPYTMAIEVAALLAAADFATARGETGVADYLTETADVWNELIERWTYVTGTKVCGDCDVDGYYIRIAPPETAVRDSPVGLRVELANQCQPLSCRAECLISPDALALVRLGLRRADDPRIVNTLQVIDNYLLKRLATGRAWNRYNHDGYGELAGGDPYAGCGVGRPWPLLVAERAHYALAAGDRAEAERLRGVLEAQAGAEFLLPEQVWDEDDRPDRGLFNGRATGAARPLVWAHAEYLKLICSLQTGTVFDLPPQPARYRTASPTPRIGIWNFSNQCGRLPKGRKLRLEVGSAATVRWTDDGWATTEERSTRSNDLGVHLLDLPTGDLPEKTRIGFTFRWVDGDRWEGRNFEVVVQ